MLLVRRIAAYVPAPVRQRGGDAVRAWRQVRDQRSEAEQTLPLPDAYLLPGAYESRSKPLYDDQDQIATNWQQSVYDEAVSMARANGIRRIVDIGCGDGRKLARLHPEFEIVGIDFGKNIEVCRTRYDFGQWIEHDLEQDVGLPTSQDMLAGTLIVCADVVEHLVQPEILLEKLKVMLSEAHALLISTPDRARTWGPSHMGPPPNPGHVREWTRAEFAAWLRSVGFERGNLRFVQSNDVSPERNTILATLR